MSFLGFVVTNYHQHSHTGLQCLKSADDQEIKLCMGKGEKLPYSSQNDQKNSTKLIGDAECYAVRDCNSIVVFLFYALPGQVGGKTSQDIHFKNQ